ncbi:MAG: Lrp/AsnC ligand binding domain-containing protein [Sulfolobales archaeon]|nr:Lrp/AsnC ligand binding domain-containing protein [Sulfolobales archaeon]
MPIAIVLVNTEIGSETEVFNALKSIEGIKEVYETYGMYDIVAIVEAQSHDVIRDIIINKNGKLPHVKSTTTMIVVEHSRIS